MKKILTVSIAAYNMEKYLKDALDSFIIEDAMDKLEVFIVDDGSKDKTSDIGREYEIKYPDCFRLISKTNGGWGSTVNCSIKNATGKYFKILDGDDYFDSEYIKEFLEYLEKSETDIVLSPFKKFQDTTNRILEEKRYDEAFFEEGEVKKLSQIIENYKGMEMHACAVKTDILKNNKITLLEHCFYTDEEFMIKVCYNCKTVSYYPQSVYCYRVGREGQSVSPEGMRKYYKDRKHLLETIIRYVQHIQDECKIIESEEEIQKIQNIVEYKLISIATAQYYSLLYLQSSKLKREELRNFDKWLKQVQPEIYYGVKSRNIKILRKLNFIIIEPFAYRIKKYLKNSNG